VYTPLYAGVFWDVQNPILEDIERIEIIRGPGASLWGANAMNGVINVVSKSSVDTQGALVSAGAGSFLQDRFAARYGGKAGEHLYYRVYGQHFDRDNTFIGSRDAPDNWRMSHGGFRADWLPAEPTIVTLQGDFYGGFGEGSVGDTTMDGQNVLGRWTRQLGGGSELQAQFYFDRTWRDIENSFSEDLKTYDLDLQHRIPAGARHWIVWGAGYRYMQDHVSNGGLLAFVPEDRDLHLVSGFAQDEIEVIPNRVRFTMGAKLEHHTYSGFDVQPSARVTWTPSKRHTLWGAVSRAIRAPSRIDTDFHTPPPPVPPGSPALEGGPDFESETVIAYEMGYRIRPVDSLQFSVAGYVNSYRDLRSLDQVGPDRYVLENHFAGEVWGVEVSGAWQATDWWRLQAGYTHIHKTLWVDGGVNVNPSIREGNDPENMFSFRSKMDLRHNLHLDFVGRYVDSLESPEIPAYFALDLRIGWQVSNLELAIIAQNVLDDQHPEFGENEIPRSIFGKATWRF
jgi:iron complex outermembrane receptor protein